MARYRTASLAEVPKIIENKIMPKRMHAYTRFTWDNVVKKNPVDTYTSANSWFVTNNAPSNVKPEYKDYGKFPSMPAYLRSLSKFKVFFTDHDLIYITNNQDYVWKLESGGTNRFPVPWIRPTVTQMVSLARAGALTR